MGSAAKKSFNLNNNSILLNTVQVNFDDFKEKTFIDGRSEFENVLRMEEESSCYRN